MLELLKSDAIAFVEDAIAEIKENNGFGVKDIAIGIFMDVKKRPESFIYKEFEIVINPTIEDVTDKNFYTIYSSGGEADEKVIEYFENNIHHNFL